MKHPTVAVNPVFSLVVPRAELFLLAAGMATAETAAHAPSTDLATRTRVLESYAQLPLAFAAHPGRTGRQVTFVARGRGYTILVASTEVTLTAGKSSLRMKLAGSNRATHLTGTGPLPGKANYFIGRDPQEWRARVETYAKVICQGIYRGVDVVYYGTHSRLEYDFLVAPGTNPEIIDLEFDGVGNLGLDADGDLMLSTRSGQFRLRKPAIYQQAGDRRWAVAGRYALRNPRHVGFRVGDYDRTKPLVIDPVLSYSTYLGGSNEENRHASSDFRIAGIAVDAEGNAYVVGSTESVNFPVTRPFQPVNRGSSDGFVAKLNPTGSALVWSTYIGGSALERAFAVAVDAGGNVYVAGRTQSLDFPTVKPAQPAFGGIEEAFVLKLDPAGAALLYSTYLGGNDTDFACGLAVDSTGNACVTGDSESWNFPVTAGAFQRACGGGVSDAFVTKLNQSGSAPLYSTYLGGSGFDGSKAVAVDSSGNAFVTGYTSSANLPTVNPVQRSLGDPQGDAFVVKLSATGSPLYSTYLGGSNMDAGLALVVDSSGAAYVAGGTMSPDFPATGGAVQKSFHGEVDGFVAKRNPTARRSSSQPFSEERARTSSTAWQSTPTVTPT